MIVLQTIEADSWRHLANRNITYLHATRQAAQKVGLRKIIGLRYRYLEDTGKRKCVLLVSRRTWPVCRVRSKHRVALRKTSREFGKEFSCGLAT